MKKITAIFILSALCAASGAVLIFCSQDIFTAVINGCRLCADVIIPSVFPFLFLSLFIVKCGLAEAAGKSFAPLVNKFFRLPGCAGAVIMTSLVGGYPAGAQMAAQLCSDGRLTNEQFEKLMCFCVCAGPAFLIGTIGECCFKSRTAGFILLAAQTFSCLILGIIACRFPFLGFKQSVYAEKNLNKGIIGFSAETFSDCTASSAIAMLNICTYVVIFSAAAVILKKTGVYALVYNIVYFFSQSHELAAAFLPAVCDTASGSMAAAGAGLLFASFAMSFGGFCVHFQIFSFSRGLSLKKIRFFAFRVLAGLLSALFTRLLLFIFPLEKTVSGNVRKSVEFSSVNLYAGAAIMLLCLAAVIMLPEKVFVNKYSK